MQHPINVLEANKLLEQIVGRQLGSIEFTHSGFTLRFDGPQISMNPRPNITVDGRAFRPDDRDYENVLCARIANIVQQIEVTPHSLRIDFEDQTTLRLLRQGNDASAPELFHFQLDPSQQWTL